MTVTSDQSNKRPLGSALIVKDHPLFREAPAMTLRSFVGIEKTATADRLAAAVQKLKSGSTPDVILPDPHLPDLILPDRHLPDVPGRAGLIRLKQAAHGVPVIVAPALADASDSGAALPAGAAGFAPKHSQRDMYPSAFATLRAGGCYTPDGDPASAADDRAAPPQRT